MRGLGEIIAMNDHAAAIVQKDRILRNARIETLAERLTFMHNETGDLEAGGCTMNDDGEEYAGNGYAIGCGEAHNHTTGGRYITVREVKTWLHRVYRVGMHFGTWYDHEKRQSHLDLVEIHGNLNTAADIGKIRGERYLWDFANSEQLAIADHAGKTTDIHGYAL